MDPELKFSKHTEIQVQANKIQGLICRLYEHIDSEIMKNFFIALVRPHQEFGHFVSSQRLIRNIKLLEEVESPPPQPLNWGTYYMKRIKLPSQYYHLVHGNMIEAYKNMPMTFINSNLLCINWRGITRRHEVRFLKRYCKTIKRRIFFF